MVQCAHVPCFATIHCYLDSCHFSTTPYNKVHHQCQFSTKKSTKLQNYNLSNKSTKLQVTSSNHLKDQPTILIYMIVSNGVTIVRNTIIVANNNNKINFDL